MRSIILLFILFTSVAMAQKDTTINISKDELKENDVFQYYAIQQPPLFNGAKNKEDSEKNIDKYIKSCLKETETSKTTIYLSFVINELGYVYNVIILKGGNEKQNNKAVDIIKNMPTWKSGMKDGKNVKVSYTVEIIM